MFFKRKPKINEQTIKKQMQKLETTYTDKNIDKLIKAFHPDQHNISFLNHFSLMMNFQIYNITSEILNVEVLDMSEEEATFTYTRKHMYTCVNEEDENGTNPNNISSYYVQLKIEDKKIWITKYARYSELFLDLDGHILPGAKAVVPRMAYYYDNMKRFIDTFQLEHFKPATYVRYGDSELIGYYPEEERYSYDTSESLTYDYFQEIDTALIGEHTKILIEADNVEYGTIHMQEKNYSIIELKFRYSSELQHELILSMFAPDGFFMIRFLKSSNAPIKEEFRQHLIEKMKATASKLDVSA